MKLSDEIAEKVKGIREPEDGAREVSLRRWLGVSDPDVPEPDYLPLTVAGIDEDRPDENVPIGMDDVRFPKDEQFDDPEKMLYEQLVGMARFTRFPGDAVPCIAPQFNNPWLLTCLGLRQVVSDGSVWPERCLCREEAAALHMPDDLASAGLMPNAVRFVQYARSVLPDHVPLGLYYMMSPFDLAYLVRGDGFFTDMVDAPDGLHLLLDMLTDLFIESTRLLKAECGEPADRCYYWPSTVLQGGCMLCEDVTVMVSPAQHREFCIPYTRRCLDALGGGWVHFCGDGRQLLDSYLDIANLRGVQFGQLDLNGPTDAIVRRFVERGKAFNCVVPWDGEHSWAEHFDRMLAPLAGRKGLYTGAWIPVETPDVGESILATWHAAQDRAFANLGDT